eukprot:4148951-Alexandrium_andersonii.AAC.1
MLGGDVPGPSVPCFERVQPCRAALSLEYSAGTGDGRSRRSGAQASRVGSRWVLCQVPLPPLAPRG